VAQVVSVAAVLVARGDLVDAPGEELGQPVADLAGLTVVAQTSRKLPGQAEPLISLRKEPEIAVAGSTAATRGN
jgi:hypothetical protein